MIFFINIREGGREREEKIKDHLPYGVHCHISKTT
jgi:hypothetical protein